MYAIYKKYGKDMANNFYSIPTSKIAYEFTRKVYNLLELDMKQIEEDYTSYDLIKENDLIERDTIKINNKKMKFDVIVGNPPYQADDGGAGPSAGPIYNLFVDISKKIASRNLCIVMPSRWYTGGKGLDEFRERMLKDMEISELHDFLNPEIVFPSTNNRGGVCFVLWDMEYDNEKKQTKVFTYKDDFIPIINIRKLKTDGFDVFIRHQMAVIINNKFIMPLDLNLLKIVFQGGIRLISNQIL